MPSVGALTVSIKAETESLRRDLDKATARIKQFETSTKATSRSVDQSFGRMGTDGARKLASGLMIASGAMRAFDKTTDATTKSALEGISKIAAAFAIGGPLLAGVVAFLEVWAYKQEQVTKRIKETQEASAKLTGFRIDATDTLESMADKDATATQKLNKQLREQEDIVTALRSKLAVDDMFGGMRKADRGTVENELAARLKIIAAIGNQIQMEQALESIRLGGLGRGKEIEAARMDAAGVPSGEIGLLQQIAEYELKIAYLRDIGTDAARREVRELTLQLEGTKELLVVTREIADAKVTDDISQEIALRSAVTDEMRKQLEMQREMKEWERRGASPALIQQLQSATLRSEAIKAWRPVMQTLESGLTDAIVDGITTGFKNGGDIAKRIVDSLLSQLVGSLVSSGLNAIMGAIGGGLGGGGGIASIATSLVGGIGGGGGGGVSPLPLLDAG